METVARRHRVDPVQKMLHCRVKRVKIYLPEEFLSFREGERSYPTEALESLRADVRSSIIA